MSGLNVTIMAIAGSGNHGITNFVGVLSAAEALGASEEQTATALAISSMITIYIKAHIKRMTAFLRLRRCSGHRHDRRRQLSAGRQLRPRRSTPCRRCWGPSAECSATERRSPVPYKLSTAASLAVQAAYLAREGCFVPAGVGIIGNTIEQTFANVGRLNDQAWWPRTGSCGHHCGESTTYGRPQLNGRIGKNKIMIVLKGRSAGRQRRRTHRKSAVVLEDDRIRLVCRQSELPDDPTAEVYELEDGTIMPGLIDAHVHMGWGSATVDWISMTPQLSMARALRDMAQLRQQGYTAFRDLGSDVLLMRPAVAEGRWMSPVFSAPGASSRRSAATATCIRSSRWRPASGHTARLHRQRCG